MRRYGYQEIYEGRPYTMLNLNGMKYWTMGAPVPETILINRKYVTPWADATADEDAVACESQSTHPSRGSGAEIQAVMELIGDVSHLAVLDIGCGTSNVLDWRRPARYTGIDPSFARIAHLRARHLSYGHAVMRCRLEEFVGAGFDLAVCLFGAADAIHPEHLAAMPSRLKPGGRYIVLLEQSRVGHWDDRRDSASIGVLPELAGERRRIGSYVVVAGRTSAKSDHWVERALGGLNVRSWRKSRYTRRYCWSTCCQNQGFPYTGSMDGGSALERCCVQLPEVRGGWRCRRGICAAAIEVLAQDFSMKL